MEVIVRGEPWKLTMESFSSFELTHPSDLNQAFTVECRSTQSLRDFIKALEEPFLATFSISIPSPPSPLFFEGQRWGYTEIPEGWEVSSGDQAIRMKILRPRSPDIILSTLGMGGHEAPI